MKKIIVAVLPVLIFLNGCAQPTPDHRSSDEVLINLQLAVNNRDFSTIESFLAADYQYETMSGDMARNVLSQVITQYPKIDSITLISTMEQGNQTTLSVVIHNENESSNRKIVLDKNLNLMRADIAQISVKGHSSPNGDPNPNIAKGTLTFPFELSETGHIVVEASVNGVKGNFIVDSGSGGYLLLNDQFQTYASAPNQQPPVGVLGVVNDAGSTKIKRFEWGKLTLTKVEASTANLVHLEKKMDIENFAGIIGYEVLKNQVVELDYSTRQLTLWSSSESFNTKYPTMQEAAVPFEMVFHIPVIEVTFGSQKLRFGLDCAAQGNLLLSRLEESMTPQLSNKRTELLGGSDNNYKKVIKGQLKGVSILDRKYNMDFVFGDLFGGHHEVTRMDGLLGYPLLSSQKTAINFIDNKLHFLN
ncbi:hypothetical protein [Ekhidna sp.]|uniref:hypothetical protein n=1 Tax=Ekhidna sp. TaxID=2608089 RepID=UPI003298A693